MFYSADEYAPDDITSYLDHPDWDEQRSPWEAYCNYCEEEGHTFSSCPQRDDDYPDNEI